MAALPYPFDASAFRPANDVDWAPLMQPVAEKLLGSPNSRLTRGTNWRYGTNGSLSVDVERGVWSDHEHNCGGGVLQLIVHRKGGSSADAVLWLRDEGLLDGAPRARRERSEHWDYYDAAGQPLCRIERFYPKNFRQSVWDTSRGEFRCFTRCMEGVRRVPYRLPELLASATDEIVFVVEGERCCERLRELGFVATTNAGGAKKWESGWGAKYFPGRSVVILPDNDEAGRDHEKIVRADLQAHAAIVATLVLPNLPEKGDIIDWLNAGGTAGKLKAMAIHALADTQAEPAIVKPAALRDITAEPYVWTEPSKIPVRPWLYGNLWLRGTAALLIAPGATGKTALLIGHALALATGRNLLDQQVWEGPHSVWVWNLEDSKEEMTRLIQAAALHHGIAPEDVAGRLFLNSGLDGSELVITERDHNKDFTIRRPVVEALVLELKAKKIDVLIVDPFVSCHSVPENDNSAIDMVAKEWARVAKAANCAVVLAHHTSKLGDGTVTAERARGASALVNAARSALTLNRMSEKEAADFGISSSDAGRYVKAYDDKPNRAPRASHCKWFYLHSVSLNNGGMGGLLPGDNMPVVVPWQPPNVRVQTFSQTAQEEALRLLAAGRYRSNEQATEWAGKVVAPLLGLSLEEHIGQKGVKQQLKLWEQQGRLRIVRDADNRGKIVPFYEVVPLSPPLHHEVEVGGEVESSPITTTAPF